MKAVCLVLLLSAAIASASLTPPTAQGAVAPPTPAKIQCSSVGQKNVHATYKPIKCELGAQAKWDGDDLKWTANAFNNLDGSKRTENEKLPGSIDLCKMQPEGFCNQRDSNKFCDLPKAKAAKLCCPFFQVPVDQRKVFSKRGTLMYAGCPTDAKVAGMPRSFMPQIVYQKEPQFVQWVNAQLAKIENRAKDAPAFTITEIKDYDISKLKPSQDEIFADNSYAKVCNNPQAPSPKPPSDPVVCNDDYIFDGHHRWSQSVFCKNVEGCTPSSTITIRQASMDCASLIGLVQAHIDYGGKDLTTGAKVGSNKVKHNTDDVVEFASFAELFGRASHTSREAAGLAYVEMTRQRLADIGLELKGGDQALRDLWEHRHAPRLWKQ